MRADRLGEITLSGSITSGSDDDLLLCGSYHTLISYPDTGIRKATF